MHSRKQPEIQKITFSPKEIARATGLSDDIIWEKIRENEIKSIQITPRRRVVHKDDLMAWIESRRGE